jgi:hypothetical protein
VHPDRVPIYAGDATVAVVLGPQDDRFTAAGIAAFLEGPYEMLPQSDRMGARLKGPFIEHTRGHDIVSDGIPGRIQVIGEASRSCCWPTGTTGVHQDRHHLPFHRPDRPGEAGRAAYLPRQWPRLARCCGRACGR